MKSAGVIKITVTFLILLLFSTCEERESTNPFDPDCPKELFTPSELKSEQINNTIKLTWKQENTNISGFIINRNANDGTMVEVIKVGQYDSEWIDNNIVGKTKYGYEIFAYAGENLSNSKTTYITPVLKPIMLTSEASNIGHISAMLNGIVNANDFNITVLFEYGTTTSYGNNIVALQNPISGRANTIANANISDLMPNTMYHFRIIAIAENETTYGEDFTFKTKEIEVPSGLLAYYPFNGNINDESGNKRHGVSEKVTYEGNKLGVQNSSAYFYGNSYVKVQSIGETKSFSIALWYKTVEGGFVLSTDNIFLYTDKTNNFFGTAWNITGGTYSPGGNPVYFDNKWHHVVVSHDGDDSRIITYFDGVVGHNRPNSSDFVGNNTDIYIGFDSQGKWGYKNPDFTGAIDEIYFYNRALSSEEVQQLFLSKN